MRRAELANVLRKIADAIEHSNMTVWEDFDIELKPSKTRSKLSSADEGRAKRAELDPVGLNEVSAQLMKASTREEASQILEKLGLTRRELEALARPRSVHLTKDDSVQRIKDKLIEAAVGSRLNSLAIRGK